MTSSNRTSFVGYCLTSLTAVTSLMAVASPALAQDVEDVPPASDAPAGQDAVKRGVQGPAGSFSGRLLLDVNLSDSAAGEPISLMPNLYYSFTDLLQLGVVHDGPMGWQTRPGPGLCLTGEDGGCPKVYNNIGFDAMYGLAFGKLHLSAHGTFYVNSIDPSSMSLAVGAAGKAHLSEGTALYFDPQIAIALSDRDVNDDALFLPLELQFQLSPPTVLKVLSGVSGSLSELGDTYQVPVGLGLMQNINPSIDVGARFSFDNLLGHKDDGVGRADARSLGVLMNVRM